MKTSTALVLAALVAAGAAGLYVFKKYRSRTPRPGAIRIGDQLDHEFKKPMYNDRGVRSLQHLRGQPILILIWGKN